MCDSIKAWLGQIYFLMTDQINVAWSWNLYSFKVSKDLSLLKFQDNRQLHMNLTTYIHTLKRGILTFIWATEFNLITLICLFEFVSHKWFWTENCLRTFLGIDQNKKNWEYEKQPHSSLVEIERLFRRRYHIHVGILYAIRTFWYGRQTAVIDVNEIFFHLLPF